MLLQIWAVMFDRLNDFSAECAGAPSPVQTSQVELESENVPGMRVTAGLSGNQQQIPPIRTEHDRGWSIVGPTRYCMPKILGTCVQQ